MKKLHFPSLALAGLLLAVAGLEFSGCKKGAEDPALSLRSRKARLTGAWTVTSFGDTNTFEGTNAYSSTDSEGYDYSYSSEMTSTARMMFDGTSLSIFNIETQESTNSSNGNSTSYDSEFESTMDNGNFEMSSREEYTYSEGNDVYTFEADGDYESSMSMNYVFNGDGTFSATMMHSMMVDYSYVEDGSTIASEIDESATTDITGTWAFIGKNKADGFENRERIALWYKTYDETSESKSGTSYSEWDYSYDEDEDWSYEDIMDDTDTDEVWEIVMLKNKEMKVRRTYRYESNQKSTYKFSDNDPYTESSEDDYEGVSTGSSTLHMTRE